MVVIVLGAFRSWRMQNAMVRGKAISGGFDIILIGVGVFLVRYTTNKKIKLLSLYCYRFSLHSLSC